MFWFYILVCFLCWFRLVIQNRYPSGVFAEIINSIFGRVGLIILWPFVVMEQVLRLIIRE